MKRHLGWALLTLLATSIFIFIVSLGGVTSPRLSFINCFVMVGLGLLAPKATELIHDTKR